MKRRVNIVLDPVAHLNTMGNIVDDIASEIVSRNKISPQKFRLTEQNNVEVMEGFGKRTITLSKSVRELHVGNEKEELDTVNENSAWKLKKRAIQRRSKGWINRFQKDMSSAEGGRGRVQLSSEDALDPDEDPDHDEVYADRVLVLASHLGSAAAHKERVQCRPEKPRLETLEDLSPFSDRLLQSCLCVVCCAIVAIDCERVSCEHCPVVAHR